MAGVREKTSEELFATGLGFYKEGITSEGDEYYWHEEERRRTEAKAVHKTEVSRL